MKNTLFLIAIGGLLWGAIAFAQKDASLKAGSDPKAEVKTEVVAMHALLMKLPKPASASVDPVSASLAGPDVCGKTYKPADVLSKGIPIVLGGQAMVKGTAPNGVYNFFTFVRVRDQTGKVIKQSSGKSQINKTGTVDISTDFGFIEVIQNCYCDATKLTIESSVSSIGPAGDFILHQYDNGCVVSIIP